MMGARDPAVPRRPRRVALACAAIVPALALALGAGPALAAPSVAPAILGLRTGSAPMTATPTAMSLSVGASGRITVANATGRRITATAANAAIATVAIAGNAATVTGVAAGSTQVTLSDGTSSVTVPVTVVGGAAVAFRGNVVLGVPTTTSIRANVYAADQGGTVTLVYGTAPGAYPAQSASTALVAGRPVELALSGLRPDTRYYYRLLYQPAGQAGAAMTGEATFHTARPAGSSFTFALQGDSHPERAKTMFDATLYERTLATAAADVPDFYVAMGDDFSVDTLDAATLDAARVQERYALQRPWLSLVGRSAPLFLVNGNHEQAARCNLDGTPNNVAVWAQNARNAFYAQPATDGFYSGNPELVPFIGLLRNHYAWTWGDALFVVIDPYWASPVCVDNVLGGGAKRSDMWDVTHGDAQYQWLKATLEQSRAKYKFVFAHHVMGTGRGGVELAKLWEWGGEDTKGADQFASKRPGWASPIHRLMASNGVTIFFQGHDHVWARQKVDGVTYQTLSVPADPNYAPGFASAYLSGDVLPGSGYTRVSVAPGGVTVEYVRTYLPADEGPGRVSGSVAFRYTLP